MKFDVTGMPFTCALCDKLTPNDDCHYHFVKLQHPMPAIPEFGIEACDGMNEAVCGACYNKLPAEERR